MREIFGPAAMLAGVVFSALALARQIMDTVASTRRKEIARIQRTLERLHSPRLQMMLIVALTAAVGFLASFAFFHVGVDSMCYATPSRL